MKVDGLELSVNTHPNLTLTIHLESFDLSTTTFEPFTVNVFDHSLTFFSTVRPLSLKRVIFRRRLSLIWLIEVLSVNI